MATEDRFDITEWFKLIKDRVVACKSNDEMTKTKSPYQLQEIQTSRDRPPQRPAPAMNPAPYCTYHKKTPIGLRNVQWQHMDADQRHRITKWEGAHKLRIIRGDETRARITILSRGILDLLVQHLIEDPLLRAQIHLRTRNSDPRWELRDRQLRVRLRLFMLNDFEDNLIINEQNLPRSINVILKNVENHDVVQPETEFEKSTTSKKEASIKSIKSFDYECVG